MPDWSTQYAMIIGVGVTMDNMLYIIAGLVLILLVAGLVLRKKKAQAPSVQPQVKSGTKAATLTPTAKTDDTLTRSREDIDKKFDHITIAERFIDQQRHDKAIETINRGLTEKPNDSQLLLKLLSIYATIDQPDNFKQVYDTIKAHSDAKSIAQADELKALFFEEQTQIAAQVMPVEDNTNFESIDFDLPTGQFDNNQLGTKQAPSDQDTRHTSTDDSINNVSVSNDFNDTNANKSESAENDFDLTLNDFEDDFEAPTVTNAASATSLNVTEDKKRDTSAIDNAADEDSDISDFDFNFDISEDNNTPADTAVRSNSASDEMTLDNDEFVLDFDDLATDVDSDTKTVDTINQELTLDRSQTDAAQSEDDFTLSLDDFNESDTTETALESQNTRFDNIDNNSDFDNFVLEDSGVVDTKFTDTSFKDSDFDTDNVEAFTLENAKLEAPTFEETGVEGTKSEKVEFDDNKFEEINFEEEQFDDNSLDNLSTEAASITSTAPLLFDDNTLLEEDFDFESDADTSIEPTSAAPVKDERAVTLNSDTESAKDFSSRFSADFDFVKSLDSNQVTLDLASQYVQLGEYDSAKRLLKEVMTHGNDEQQNQAKRLLERTA